MTEHTPSWELYGTFLEVMRQGSLSGAARTLSVAQPTVRRRVAALEGLLGSPLFSRSPNGLLPTDVARRILPFAETMEATSRSLVRAASADPEVVQGTVRIAVTELVGVEVLPDLLVTLRQCHPLLQVELVLSNTLADVAHQEADLAIRMAPPRGASLVARRVGTVSLGFFAAPAYLEGRPLPATLRDLLQHDLIGYDTNPQLLEGLVALGLDVSRRSFSVRTDHDGAYLHSIRAGLGIGVTHVPLALDPVLVRVLPDLTLPVDVWLVAHQDLRHTRRIRVVLDHLADALRTYVQPHELPASSPG
jgi:DNA-binding transcriptional LysR family regulator